MHPSSTRHLLSWDNGNGTQEEPEPDSEEAYLRTLEGHCSEHGAQRLTGDHKVNRDKADPTEIYKLACGHWSI